MNYPQRSHAILSRRILLHAVIASVSAFSLSPGGIFAQQSTATPASEAITGIIAASERRFEASGLRLLGAGAISVFAYQFDSAEHAAEGFAAVIEFFRDYFETGATAMQQASAPRLGDQRVAYVGELPESSEPDARLLAGGLFGWQDDDVVIVMIAIGLAGDQLAELFAIGNAIVGRVPGPRAAAAISFPGEMRRGGIWDVLPTLEDVPEGFVFLEDRVPGQASGPAETPTP
jgi:hypothetical protein